MEDGDGDAGADEVGECVEAEADVPGQIGYVWGEAFPVDSWVPYGGHWSALHDEEEHLRKVTS